jgi:hypothetical protein
MMIVIAIKIIMMKGRKKVGEMKREGEQLSNG